MSFDFVEPLRPTSNTVALPKRSDYLTRTHGWLNVSCLIASHLALVLWFAGLYWLGLSTWSFILLAVPAALAHQKYLSEWIHEAAHYNLHPSRSWNDYFIQLLAGVFFANDIVTHRAGHFRHHGNSNYFHDADPDTQGLAVHNRRQFRRTLVKDLSGITALKMFWGRNSSPDSKARTRGFLSGVMAFQMTLITVLWWYHGLLAFAVYYWVLLSLYPMMNRFRGYGQHAEFRPDGTVRFDGSEISRTTEGGVLDRLFFTSGLMLYHFEHHQYPYLPFRALPKLCERKADANRFTQNRWRLMKRIYLGLR